VELVKDEVYKVGLLGTAFTMEQNFYSGRISSHGIEVVTPNSKDRALVHEVIYQELCLGHILDKSRLIYLDVIRRLEALGAQAIILGCTEIGLLVNQTDINIKLYDTTRIHAQAAVEFMLA